MALSQETQTKVRVHSQSPVLFELCMALSTLCGTLYETLSALTHPFCVTIKTCPGDIEAGTKKSDIQAFILKTSAL